MSPTPMPGAVTSTRAAVQQPDGGDELLETKRLVQVAGRAQASYALLHVGAAERGHDDDRQRRPAAAQLTEDLESVHAGQVKIDDDDVGLVEVDRFEHPFAARDADDLKAFVGEPGLQIGQ